MGESKMKLRLGNKYRNKLCSCGCGKIKDESICSLCYSTSKTLIGWRGTGDDDHFVCSSCLKRLNKINKDGYYPDSDEDEIKEI